MLDYEIKDFDKYFRFEILRRGFDYYKNGKVLEITLENNTFYALVSGTEIYKVEVILDNNGYKLDCNCPYAEENNCKHMAAVLYCLKHKTIPVKEDHHIEIKCDEVSTFIEFKKQFKREYYKQFRNKYYFDEDDEEDYINFINKYIEVSTKYITSDINFAYQIFEYFLMEVNSVDIYSVTKKLFSNLFESFKELLKNKNTFNQLLNFIRIIYTYGGDEYYFNYKEELIEILYKYIEFDWQAEYFLKLLYKLDKNRDIYDYEHDKFKIKIIYLNYKFISKEKALKLAECWLDISEVCDFLLEANKNNNEKQIELLEKMILANKDYSNEKYYDLLKDIYKNNDKEKYKDLVIKSFKEHKCIKYYREIKELYFDSDWNKIKYQYIDEKDLKLYRDICVEEEMYDELIKHLENEWIVIVNEYFDLLINKSPQEMLDLYKNKILQQIDNASSRQEYQKLFNYFNKLLNVIGGKEVINNIIIFAKEKYKNRKAFQEEIEFYEETYL